jgi:hypothetical protein
MDLGAWVLGALLFIWQIPHFLALSWGYKNDYANAGYLFFYLNITIASPCCIYKLSGIKCFQMCIQKSSQNFACDTVYPNLIVH